MFNSDDPYHQISEAVQAKLKMAFLWKPELFEALRRIKDSLRITNAFLDSLRWLLKDIEDNSAHGRPIKALHGFLLLFFCLLPLNRQVDEWFN